MNNEYNTAKSALIPDDAVYRVSSDHAKSEFMKDKL